MGVVYEALQVSLDRVVALKMILTSSAASAELRSRFELECRALAKLSHPGIVQVFDHGVHEGCPYLVMEWCEGGSLAELLERRPVTALQAAKLVAGLAEALQVAHRGGLVHRDIKPSNILVKDRVASILDLQPGQLRIADFGLAKVMDKENTQLTRTGQVVGTALYMAPEQVVATREVGPAADVHALGAILYELLTGRVPYHASSFAAVLRLLETEEPIPVDKLADDCSPDLTTICSKCLAKNPVDRYATAGELADDLRRYLDGQPILARPPGWYELASRWATRRPVTASLVLLATLSPFAGLFYVRWFERDLVRHTALESIMQQADLLLHANDEYSDIVKRVRDSGFQVTHDPIPEKQKVPLSIPATFVHDIGRRLEHSPTSDVSVRLYSEYPFPWRVKEGGPRDQFERDALQVLGREPTQHYYRFEEKDGRNVLRYAVARVLKESCVDCHNSRADSPKKDWKVGDVRGVLEITRPLLRDETEVRRNMIRQVWGVSCLSAVLIAIALFAVVLPRGRGDRVQ